MTKGSLEIIETKNLDFSSGMAVATFLHFWIGSPDCFVIEDDVEFLILLHPSPSAKIPGEHRQVCLRGTGENRGVVHTSQSLANYCAQAP